MFVFAECTNDQAVRLVRACVRAHAITQMIYEAWTLSMNVFVVSSDMRVRVRFFAPLLDSARNHPHDFNMIA